MNQPTVTDRFIPGHAGRGRGKLSPILVVFHVQQGTNDLYYEFKNRPASNQADCTIWSKQTGELQRFLYDEDTAWTNGDWYYPTTSNPVISSLVAQGIEPNDVSLTIEHQGYYNKGFSEAQIQSTIQITAYWCVTWNIPPDKDHIIRHADVTSLKPNCPGPLFPLERIIKEVKQLVDSVKPPPVNEIILNGFTIKGEMLRNWQSLKEPVLTLGYPLTNEFEHEGAITQVYERAVLKYHPDLFPGVWDIQGLDLGRQWLAANP